MKNAVYPNQGQPIQDIYTTGISRVYIDNGNVICVLESRCGIEDQSNTYINETARLIIPLQDLENIKESIEQAMHYINKNTPNRHDRGGKVSAKKSIEKEEEYISEIEGNPIALFD